MHEDACVLSESMCGCEGYVGECSYLLEIVKEFLKSQLKCVVFFLMIISKVKHYLISLFPHENYILQMTTLNF